MRVEPCGMKCPYCLGDVPAPARKCMHCGEWLTGPQARTDLEEPAYPDRPRPGEGILHRVWHGGLTQDDVVEGVRWYVKYRIIMGIVGAIIFVIFFLGVWLPKYNEIKGDVMPGVDRRPIITCGSGQPTGGPFGDFCP